VGDSARVEAAGDEAAEALALEVLDSHGA